MSTDYIEGVAALAALKVRASVRKGVGRLVNTARGSSFPNDLGNYRGKRQPNPAPKPRTTEERRFLLAATYQTFHSRSVIAHREAEDAREAARFNRREKRKARHAARFERWKLAA